MKAIFLSLLWMLAAFASAAQTFDDSTLKRLAFETKSEGNTLVMANISGDITIEGYDGDEIVVEAHRTLHAKTDVLLGNAKAEVKVDVINNSDTIIVYVQDGCNTYGRTSGKRNHDGVKGWGYDWNCNRDGCDLDYTYTVDVSIKVPKAIHVVASTINEGEVQIENVSGIVVARNVNGGIKLSGLSREADAHTINGDLDVTYNSNPGKPCRFYSLNGDINAIFKKGLAANVSFESFNGEFFTNVDQLTALPVEVTKTTNNNGVKFKVNGNRYQVGNGGALLDFETFNGNVYLKEL